MFQVKAPAVMLAADPGNGKTFALSTLARDNRRLFYLFTDPGGEESLLDGLKHYDIPVTNVHWHYVSPSAGSWTTMLNLLEKVNAYSYESLAGIKNGINKEDHRQFFALIEACANFKCDRTGKEFGPLEELDPDTSACAFDGLTGLNKLAKECTVGSKPTLHEGEWGVGQTLEETFIRQFTSDIRCPTAITCHLTKVMNNLEGRMYFGIDVLGQKLAPKLPHLFSDMVFCYREGKQFYWSTIDDRMSLKTRNLPLDHKIEPDFAQIIARWEQRKTQANVPDTSGYVAAAEPNAE